MLRLPTEISQGLFYSINTIPFATVAIYSAGNWPGRRFQVMGKRGRPPGRKNKPKIDTGLAEARAAARELGELAFQKAPADHLAEDEIQLEMDLDQAEEAYLTEGSEPTAPASAREFRMPEKVPWCYKPEEFIQFVNAYPNKAGTTLYVYVRFPRIDLSLVDRKYTYLTKMKESYPLSLPDYIRLLGGGVYVLSFNDRNGQFQNRQIAYTVMEIDHLRYMPKLIPWKALVRSEDPNDATEQFRQRLFRMGRIDEEGNPMPMMPTAASAAQNQARSNVDRGLVDFVMKTTKELLQSTLDTLTRARQNAGTDVNRMTSAKLDPEARGAEIQREIEVDLAEEYGPPEAPALGSTVDTRPSVTHNNGGCNSGTAASVNLLEGMLLVHQQLLEDIRRQNTLLAKLAEAKPPATAVKSDHSEAIHKIVDLVQKSRDENKRAARERSEAYTRCFDTLIENAPILVPQLILGFKAMRRQQSVRANGAAPTAEPNARGSVPDANAASAPPDVPPR
jgi:hypothetical protein